MSADFLLELLSEEIPARMQGKASADLARLFGEELGNRGIEPLRLEIYATPRRLALIARGLPEATQAVSEEIKGPRAGAPSQALEGFLRKTGLSADQLVERDGVLFARIDRPGRATAEVLAEAIPVIVRAFPWPKSMRWGSGALRWVRPLQGIVALLGDDVVEFEIDGIASGAATLGHRFHHPGMITIGNADDYAAKLRACHVILDTQERQAIIREGAAAVAAAAGLAVVPDEGLVAENAGLTEWPVPLLGSFDPAFLEVPREVIQLTMRTNQKYFALTHADGSLAPNFVCTANIEAADGGAAIAAGNARVLSARLSDARFFWEQDLKVPLAEHAKKLDQIVFHEKLGTVADKVERVAKLARWLVDEGIVKPLPFGGGVGVGLASSRVPSDDRPHTPTLSPEGERERLADMAEQAARLCKADLVTAMVGEFPELQGVMGGYYARAVGLPDEVADAIRDHYKPVGQGDEVPSAPVTVAVSLADKLDSVAQFFDRGLKPTGSKDPFALRRSALGIAALVTRNELRLPFYPARIIAGDGSSGSGTSDILDFLIDRLKVQQREAGVRHDLIDAVFALGGEDDLVRLLARVKALQAFVETEDGANLLAGYKRAANILRAETKKEGDTPTRHPELGSGSTGQQAPEPQAGEGMLKQVQHDGDGEGTGCSYSPEPAEAALAEALDVAIPRAAAAVGSEDFAGAMTALAALRPVIDRFFDEVTVNDPNPDKRTARLGLLEKVRVAVHNVADFSRIEG